jgi:mono/diheme cytochrome c family protein
MPSRLANIAVLCAAAALLPLAVDKSAATDSDQQDYSQVVKGRYLATLADCAACHTNPGGKPFAGGRPIETPFGIIVAPNITSDRETGIGNWTDGQFDNALRHGIRSDGKRLFPAMPYTAYTKMSKDDVKAIRAYLATIEPARNAVDSDQLPFPLNIRLGMIVWDKLYFEDGEFKPDKSKSAEWNRGAYLVTGPGHCGACHTPKTALGGDKTSEALQGSQVQGWFAPNITNDAALGLGKWSVADVVQLLKTGHNKATAVTGPMAEEVEDASSQFADADLTAIATYLKDQPGNSGNLTPIAESDARMTAGKAVFRDTCSACHGLDGKGIPHLFPSLAEASSVSAQDPTSSIRVLLRGARSAATAAEPTAPAMPSFGWQLNDDQAAAVLTYIRNSWGHAAPAVTPSAVGKTRSALAQRAD